MIYTQRIFWPSYDNQKKLSHLLQFLSARRDICDEISFFTEGDGLDWRYVPSAEVERRAQWLTEVVPQARAAGFGTVVNVLNTMGHSDEGGPWAPTVPWQPMVGHDGAVCRQCSCPFDTAFLADVTRRYELFARSGAGKYWIDDDVRMNNHAPADWGCFCETCIADFSQSTARSFTRVSLVTALCEETAVRDAWLARSNEVIKRLLAVCAEGVARSEPGAEIGLMTPGMADILDSGADFPEWLGVLSASTKGQVWIRPGGGFWSDSHPRQLLHKLHAVGTAVNAAPREVLATWEVENYPFIQGDKSARQTGLESLLAILSGQLAGIMFDVLDPAGNDLEPFSTWADDLARWRPLWDRAADLVEGTVPWGWKPAFSLRHFQQHASTHLEAMREVPWYAGLNLAPTGLPLTAFDEGTAGHLLCGAAARGMSQQELEAMLTQPLLMDGPAAQVFVEAGLGNRIGVSGTTEYSQGVHEVFSDHPWNGPAAGYKRSATLSYFRAQSYALQPSKGAQVLSVLRNVEGEELGAAFTVLQSANSAPVAVMGHFPYQFVLSPQRMAQLQTVSAHMLGGRPLNSSRPVAVWWRRGADKAVAVLYNAGFDEARAVAVPEGGVVALATSGVTHEPEAGTVSLPAWSVAVIEWPSSSGPRVSERLSAQEGAAYFPAP